ncbi:hypothetical protein IGI04_001229 [Brassica rapa subsp. trilocularis]|uniref:Uncharacterized protein n=1 Tax=Brassica rapa subsp. trilocularis TaxID=1813537 RepID=A0ABQ7NS40_BRACM|nr:hypothetical protein IGI04_001229 [Brassica rapa subsp. trilocularis]
MEGVGARLGRSSTRYGHGGPATVFTGPVRKWKKKWVHVSPSSKKHSSSSSVASDGSHLLFFKWAPLSQGGSGNEDGKSESNSPSEEPVTETAAQEEPPRRRFKYVPIAVLEEQKKEATEIDEEDKVEVEEDEASAVEPREKKIEEKPDMNDVPMEDNQEEEKIVRQDLNESTTDSGLNLNANDADVDADSENNPKGGEPVEES